MLSNLRKREKLFVFITNKKSSLNANDEKKKDIDKKRKSLL